MFKSNPCLSCGACCAYFLVAFVPSEAPGLTPDMAEKMEDGRLCLKGTRQRPPRCDGLKGEIGVEVKCGLYKTRPAPCRNFGVVWEEGKVSMTENHFIRCNRARAKWGLPRIKRRRVTILP